MNKRPLTVTVISVLYMAIGVGAFAGHLIQYKPQQPFDYDIVWASSVNLIALLAGVYMFRGHNWARWLAMAWMGFHVCLSIFHPRFELVVHSLLFVVLTYFLFRPAVSRYFRGAATDTA